MTPAQLASYIRWKANVDSNSPYDNTSLLPIVNAQKNKLAQAIVQVNPDYFGSTDIKTTVNNTQNYSKPADFLQFKRLDLSYTGTTTGSFRPATIVTLNDFTEGEDWYRLNAPLDKPLARIEGNNLYIYPTPTAATAGTSYYKLFYIPLPADLANLTESSTDMAATTGIGAIFHPLIGDLVVNEIKGKQGDLSTLDVRNEEKELLDILVPAAFNYPSSFSSGLPSDTQLQY
jgi:hypothetical protein